MLELCFQRTRAPWLISSKNFDTHNTTAIRRDPLTSKPRHLRRVG
jgi:hypothetical protein